jgi:glycerol-3-phosphate cytidylyltransferase
MVIGYTSGVFDLFHIGHLNLLKNSKSLCDKLIVGVTTDELVSYKNKQPVINHYERMEIVRNIKHVDVVVPQPNMEKMEMWKKLQFNIMFVGDDWFENDKWQFFEEEFKKIGVRIVYFPYTKGTSSTLINNTLKELRDEK